MYLGVPKRLIQTIYPFAKDTNVYSLEHFQCNIYLDPTDDFFQNLTPRFLYELHFLITFTHMLPLITLLAPITIWTVASFPLFGRLENHRLPNSLDHLYTHTDTTGTLIVGRA